MRLLLLCAFLAPVLAQDLPFDRNLPVTGPVDLDVRTGAGRIQVRAGDATTVRIHGIIHPHNGWTGDLHALASNPPITQQGNTIRIGPIPDEEMARHVGISYEIVTPATTKLRAHTGAGAQIIEGLRGPVDATTGAGAMDISRIGGEVRAHTGSGRVTLDAITT